MVCRRDPVRDPRGPGLGPLRTGGPLLFRGRPFTGGLCSLLNRSRHHFRFNGSGGRPHWFAPSADLSGFSYRLKILGSEAGPFTGRIITVLHRPPPGAASISLVHKRYADIHYNPPLCNV